MRQKERVYYSQYDGHWSMSLISAIVMAKSVINGNEYDLNAWGKWIKHKPKPWAKQFKPLDWDLEDWKLHLAELEELWQHKTNKRFDQGLREKGFID